MNRIPVSYSAIGGFSAADSFCPSSAVSVLSHFWKLTARFSSSFTCCTSGPCRLPRILTRPSAIASPMRQNGQRFMPFVTNIKNFPSLASEKG
ncbi:unnamed protein product [Linum tenue]|uniref:Uncharacterized protein n=2 Tax=Linum tenue TaxID=586396 RepID=A0AAV0ND82_9ROSI|nr:unnamed protein product [Linum tenue]